MYGSTTINNWDVELKEMNKGKIGETFHYPTLFFLSWAMPRYFHPSYRQTEGIALIHAKGKVPSIQFLQQ